MKNLSRTQTRSLLMLSLILISTVGVLWAFTIFFRSPIPTMRWTWIEGRRRYDVGQYPTKPVAQVVVPRTSTDGIQLNALTPLKGILSGFTVDGQIVPYYLTAEVPAVKLLGKKTGDVIEFGAKVQVKYKEVEWIFDDVISGVAPGTILITISSSDVVHAILKFGSVPLGFHELEFGRNLQMAGMPIPLQKPRPSPSPGASPSKRTPLVEYMKKIR